MVIDMAGDPLPVEGGVRFTWPSVPTDDKGASRSALSDRWCWMMSPFPYA